MTPFLVATLLALVAGGALVMAWRDHRPLFPRALAATLALAALVAGYAWWVSHGYEVRDDAPFVALSGLQLDTVAGSYRLQGTATNTSTAYAVSALPLHLRVEDCRGTQCSTRLDRTQTLLVSLSPGETRRFALVYNVAPVTMQGELRWQATPGVPRAHRPVAR